jgi:hypothetical protein
MTVGAALQAEQAKLLSLPSDGYPAHDAVDVRVGKQPYVLPASDRTGLERLCRYLARPAQSSDRPWAPRRWTP